MPRGSRSQSTPPSSSSSSSPFVNGKTSALESLRSASANSTPILPSTSNNQRLERVDEEDSVGDDSHPPSSSSPSGTTTHLSTASGGSSHADPSGVTFANQNPSSPANSSGPPHQSSSKDSTKATSTDGSPNPLYAVLRAGVHADEPSVHSPDDQLHHSGPPVTAASSSPAGGSDTAVQHPLEPPARGPSPPHHRDSAQGSSDRGRSSHSRQQRDRHGRGRSDSRSPGDAPPSNRRRMHSRSVSPRRGSRVRRRSRSRSHYAVPSRYSDEHSPRRSHSDLPRDADTQAHHDHYGNPTPAQTYTADGSRSPRPKEVPLQQQPGESRRSRRSPSRSHCYYRSRSRSHHASADHRRYRSRSRRRSRSASPRRHCHQSRS
ncbi:hypothetical protein F5878DRAFT_74643 [Lentinula raphanica]|uniref:Uncharacterized protein n=1 Tax=Lentinula raphanica TaxID=153919 RepID=A0AA38UKH9_9AGAR|nr:hypothetical protein F5878DRAFT_74643 [Lentinula raphanica]